MYARFVPLKLLILIALLGVVFSSALTLTRSPKPKTLQQIADQIIGICQYEGYRPSCYDREIPKTMDNISMEEAFEVTKLVQQQDDQYWYCHVLGHYLSQQEVAKDPQQWKTVLQRCPSGVCSNGCLHGGLQERFRSESLTPEQIEEIKPDLDTLCEARPGFAPTDLEQASCYHALGHLMMYVTDAKVNDSLDLCQELALKSGERDFRVVCNDGVFMQLFQPLEAEDFALIQGQEIETKEESDIFCSQFLANQRESCLRERWPLFNEDLQTAEGAIDFCTRDEAWAEQFCYDGVFFIIASQKGLEAEPLAEYCNAFPEAIAAKCFASSAARFLETDWQLATRAINYCTHADLEFVQQACYEQLAFYAHFSFGEGENFTNFCQQLPSDWAGKCLRKEVWSAYGYTHTNQ
jgi:hypothetical protein